MRGTKRTISFILALSMLFIASVTSGTGQAGKGAGQSGTNLSVDETVHYLNQLLESSLCVGDCPGNGNDYHTEIYHYTTGYIIVDKKSRMIWFTHFEKVVVAENESPAFVYLGSSAAKLDPNRISEGQEVNYAFPELNRKVFVIPCLPEGTSCAQEWSWHHPYGGRGTLQHLPGAYGEPRFATHRTVVGQGDKARLPSPLDRTKMLTHASHEHFSISLWQSGLSPPSIPTTLFRNELSAPVRAGPGGRAALMK